MPVIEAIVSPNGQTTFITVEILEDIWADYLWFRDEAARSFRNGDVLQTHRYLRAGLTSFLNYLTGLANRWELVNENGTEVTQSPLLERLMKLAHENRAPTPPQADLESLISLFSKLSNLRLPDEPDLFRSLSFEPIHGSQQSILAWLDDFCKLTGRTRHIDSRSVSSEFASNLGDIAEEQYHEYDSVEDDPLAFQDPPEVWELIGPANLPEADAK